MNVWIKREVKKNGRSNETFYRVVNVHGEDQVSPKPRTRKEAEQRCIDKNLRLVGELK